jgi:SHS2 domain-containing protein
VPSPPWEEIEHTADVALRVRGTTLAELFANAARGMLNLVVGDSQTRVSKTSQVKVALEAPDLETLLVDWLTELVYLMEDEAFIVSDIQVSEVAGNALYAEVTGGAEGELHRHIKAVTYHDLSIEKIKGGYQTIVVFDV